MRTVTVSRGAWVLPFQQFSVCHLMSCVGIREGRCRRDICPLCSPPLRTGFGSQNTRFCHEYILLLFSLFLLHENGLQFFRKHYDWILLIHTISTAVHTSGSGHCRRRYGDPELAGCLFTYLGPHPNTAILRHFSELRDVPHIDG